MSTLPLFAPPKLKPRWYQQDAAAAIDRELEKHRSVMVVMATGLGKAVLIAMKVEQWVNAGERVLVLAHRDELVSQLKAEIERATHLEAYIEQGPIRPPPWARVVVASAQTLCRKRRLEKYDPGHFQRVIPDEFHHYVAPTFRRPIDYFEKAKVLGVTATPDRSDKKAMGRICNEVAYTMDIWDGIENGYLVPVRGQLVEIKEIHLENVHIVAGDLMQSELDLAMLQGVEGIVKKTLELEPDRQGIGFFPGVASAQAACERMNLLKPGSACIVHGGTDPHERRDLIKKFRSYVYQYLFNCQVATEGFDAPCCSLIIQARPTASRGLYTQMVGRGTRPEPSVIDPYPGRDQAEERRASIARSSKPNMVILDFVGNSTNHDLRLASVEDMLGGKYDDDEIELAKKIRKEKQKTGEASDPMAALAEARARMRKTFAQVSSSVDAKVVKFDPFKMLDVEHENRYGTKFGQQPASEAQKAALARAGVHKKALAAMTKADASKLLDEIAKRRDKGLCTMKQLRALQKHGIEQRDISFEAASRGMDYLINMGRGPIDRQHLNRLLGIKS